MLTAPADTSKTYSRMVNQSSDRNTDTLASVFRNSTAYNRIRVQHSFFKPFSGI